MVPTARFMTIITPNCTSLMPKVRTMQEDRSEDQQSRCHIHKGADDQQEDVQDEQQDVLVVGDAQNHFTDGSSRPVKLRTKLRTEDAPMISMTTVVMFAVCTRIRGISFSRWTCR